MSLRSLILTLISLSAIAAIVVASPQASTLGVFESAPLPVELPPGVEFPQEAEFGYVTVPERHARPNGPQLKIAVARFPSLAESPAPDPLILNTGGPGDSNMDQFLPVLASGIGQALRAQRDVVIIELRGLRYSEPPLGCQEVFDAQEQMAGKDIRGAESNEILLEAMRACHQRLTAEGIDPSVFNNVETAADIALIMSSLGYERFNLFGTSAGTMVAQHVMRDYPDRVRTAVLNAAVPIGAPLLREMMRNAADRLETAFEECRRDTACAGAYPDLESRFFELLGRLNARPLRLRVAHPLTGEDTDLVLNGDRLSTWLFVSMYGNTQLPATIGRFLAGDYSRLQTSPHIFFPMQQFTYGLSYSAFSAELVDFEPSEVDVAGPYAAFTAGFSMFFSPRLLSTAQSFWTVEPIDSTLLQPLRSSIPTLVLNGRLDHVLPPRYVTEMGRYLDNGYVYLFEGVAHSPVDAGDCAIGMMLQFLADPSRAPDGSCVEQFEHTLEVADSPSAIEPADGG